MAGSLLFRAKLYPTQVVPQGVTLTLNVATEDSNGMDGHIAWQTAFLGNDGRIISCGTGNHQPDQNNGVRYIDPVTVPGSVSTGYIWPWTQVAQPPFWVDGQNNGVNRYHTNYDNTAMIYSPSDNKLFYAGRGIFDFAQNTWTYGDRSPNTLGFSDYIDTTAVSLIGGVFNPATAWCTALDLGIWAGASAGGSGQLNDRICVIERNPGQTKPWKLSQFTIPGWAGCNHSRNESVFVGKYLYLGGNLFTGNDLVDGAAFLMKIDMETRTKVADLTPANRGNEEFAQSVYDSDRQKIVRIGEKLLEYDIASNVWSDITPSNWPVGGYWYPNGVYHPTQRAIYFRGVPGGNVGLFTANFRWHKITFGSTPTRWTALNTDTNASPFQGPPEEAFGGTKHVWMTWVPNKGRVYTFGGDYGNGAGQFSGQPNMGGNFTTNEPAGAATYARDSSLCNDQYSIDPTATGTVPWRLEHPYKVRDMGAGVREVRPGRPDQVSLVWDPVRSKLWGFITVLRTEFLYLKTGVPDLWANGDMTTSGTIEPIGTYSFVPGVSGSPGTWTLETTNRLSYRLGSGTSYNGGQLITGMGDERVGLFQYDTTNNVIACLSAAPGSNQVLFTFNPATKTYEYRTFSASGYSRMDCSCSYVAIIDGWAHAVALATTSGGTRKSVMLRVNIAAALAVANQGVVPQSAIQIIDLPWSLSPGNTWENSGDASAKWQEHCGVVALDRKAVLIKSYDSIIEDGTTKLTTWDPDTRLYTASEAAPEDLSASSWCALPDTGEVFMGLTTDSSYGNLKMWKYRVR